MLTTVIRMSCISEERRIPEPNILLIVTDDQSWEYPGCHGDPAIRTPVIDNLDIHIPNWDNLLNTDPGPTKTYFKEKANNPDFQMTLMDLRLKLNNYLS